MVANTPFGTGLSNQRACEFARRTPLPGSAAHGLRGSRRSPVQSPHWARQKSFKSTTSIISLVVLFVLSGSVLPAIAALHRAGESLPAVAIAAAFTRS